MDKERTDLIVYNKKRKPKPSKVYDTYWKFAVKRQEIFFNKFQGVNYPWTDDEVLKRHKFTNAYRASDRVSQFLIQKIIYEGLQGFDEIFFRTLLFKTFNKIETWLLLTRTLGDLETNNFDFKKISKVLLKAVGTGVKIYSGAYIMASGKSIFGYDRKFQNHLLLIDKMIKEKLSEKILNSRSMFEAFTLLKSYPTIGDFLAYQYIIDLNYSASLTFSEMDFVMPGPGAKDGIKKCFSSYGDYSESDIIKYVTESQDDEFRRLGLQFKSLWGRKLQLIDCQNLFCEVDKYARVLHPQVIGISNRKRIKQLYVPKGVSSIYWYPPKWGLNNLIQKT